MTTLAEIRTKARNFIKDTGDGVSIPQKVSDVELADYANDAIGDYSRHFPRSLILTVTPPVSPIDPPTDILPGEDAVRQVEADGSFWTRVYPGEGVPLPSLGDYWYWRGGKIYLSSTPSTTLYIHYSGLHLRLMVDADILTVPLADEELIVIYMAAKFHQKMGTVAAKLDRFRERGQRDDNPLVLMHEVLMKDYNNKIADRMPRGTVRMRRQ